jgi:acetylornithine deacetylase/succinyl-diaminopimelate desuccinylase-like protein
VKQLQHWIDSHFPSILEDLFTFYRFKTISADPTLHSEMKRCAQWLSDKMRALGCHAELIQTKGAPLVYAEDLSAGPRAPTLLIYGHYDVQPTDPLELWESDPFEPVERNGNVFCRGAQDDKGQIYYAIAALAALRGVQRSLPVNLKFCIEGEEEFGSNGLAAILPTLKKKLCADYLLIVDFGIPDAKTPAITLGARGIITLDLLLRGSCRDLHSGEFGGIAYNPNRALAELLAHMWDARGRIAIPHFYDDVEELSSSEQAQFTGWDETGIHDAHIHAFANPEGSSLFASNRLLPSLEINGIAGGYAGPGFKTVIPAEARAKISSRLVPRQDPEKMGHLISDFLKTRVRKGIEVKVTLHHGGKPFRAAPDSRLAQAAARAYEELFNKPCQKMLCGASIPIVADLQTIAGASVVGIGYGLPSDNIHAPNEHFGLDRFKQGILTVARLIEHLG